jgi:uncharacterized membrane protein YgcG
MKSLEDILLFVDMECRMFGQAVSKYMIVSVCVIMFWRHSTPRSKGYFVRISMVVLVSKGGGGGGRGGGGGGGG